MTNKIEVVKLTVHEPPTLDKLFASGLITSSQIKTLTRTARGLLCDFSYSMNSELSKYSKIDPGWLFNPSQCMDNRTLFLPTISPVEDLFYRYTDQIADKMPVFGPRKAKNAIQSLELDFDPSALQALVETEFLNAVMDKSVMIDTIGIDTQQCSEMLFKHIFPMPKDFTQSDVFERLANSPYSKWEAAYPDFVWPERFIGAKIFAQFMQKNPMYKHELMKVFLHLDYDQPYEALGQFLEKIAQRHDGDRYEFIYRFMKSRIHPSYLFQSPDINTLEPRLTPVVLTVNDEVKAQSLFF